MKCKRDSDGRNIDHHTLQLMRRQRWGINIRTVFRWLYSREMDVRP